MGLMQLRTILIILFGILTGIAIIAERYKVKRLRNVVIPLIIPVLTVFYCFTAPKPDILILSALISSSLAGFFILKINKTIPEIATIICLTIFNILFGLAILKNNYYQNYIPLWFYVYLIPLGTSAYLVIKSIKPGLHKNKYPVIIYSITLAALAFLIICRAWRYRDLSLYLPIVGIILIALSSAIFAFHHYRKEIKHGSLYSMFLIIYGLMLLVMGVIPDW